MSVAELAQAVASIHLALPDWARGRPVSLVRDTMYSKVYDEKMPLEFYWRCIRIMEAVEKHLSDERGRGRQERSNIRFHLAKVAVAFAVTSSRPKPSIVLKTKANQLGDRLDVVYDWVAGEREKVA